MIHRRHDDVDLQIATLAELGMSTHCPVGMCVLVEEDIVIYTCAGHAAEEIARHLGWGLRNVWLPNHVLANVRKWHTIFLDPVAAATLLLQHPDSVHSDLKDRSNKIFFSSAHPLRDAGLLMSKSTRYVDAIIEERQVENGYILRLFHLSPRSNYPRGDRLWP